VDESGRPVERHLRLNRQPEDNTPRTAPETIRALAQAIDRLIAWQHYRAERKEAAKYRRVLKNTGKAAA
jgi:IS5 family transposase